jgi:DNA-binding response OmpR family regulator
MDLGGARLVARIGRGAAGAGVPRIGADPAGDLRTKLEAFERGVDDIRTLPSTPGELLARVVAPVRRAYRGVAAVRPVIRLRDPQIGVLHRAVRPAARGPRLTATEYLCPTDTRAQPCRDVARPSWRPDRPFRRGTY